MGIFERQVRQESSWFERGWTIQESIAPSEVVFYDSRWNEIGHLRQICEDVAKVTKISQVCLLGSADGVGSESVATRMSWASRRQTIREEDMAYCLLGLFDVNMPLLYGEGAKKAFHRLQTEMMKISDDESLFAWTSDQVISGLLANQPSYFADSGGILVSRDLENSRPPFSLPNKGLEIALPEKHLNSASKDLGSVPFYLRCHRDSNLRDILYVELRFLMGLNCASRIRCATLILKETSLFRGNFNP